MVKRLLYGAASRFVLHPWFRITRGITLGVRVAVFDPDGRIFLIRHTYAPGWLLPGGGVESGETAAKAAARELMEEGAIRAEGPLALHGVFLNDANFKGDHVVLFRLDAFSRGAWSPTAEIAESGFFAADALPPGTSGGTRRRLAELSGGAPPSEVW